LKLRRYEDAVVLPYRRRSTSRLSEGKSTVRNTYTNFGQTGLPIRVRWPLRPRSTTCNRELAALGQSMRPRAARVRGRVVGTGARSNLRASYNGRRIPTSLNTSSSARSAAETSGPLLQFSDTQQRT